jgi:DNA-binding transcriptional regulator YhcF (GntR family)
MEKRKVYDKTQKRGEDAHFIKLPSELRHYVYLPEFKAEMTFLYALIVDLWNKEVGYAYPSQEKLAMYYGKALNTTKDHLKILEKYGLIEKNRNSLGMTFVPLEPLAEHDFFVKYREADHAYRERLKQIEIDREASRLRMMKSREKRSGS